MQNNFSKKYMVWNQNMSVMTKPEVVNARVDVHEFSFEVVVKPILRKFKDGKIYKTYRITLPKNFAEHIEGKKVLVTVKVIDD